MRFAAFDDQRGVGRAVMAAAKARGHEASVKPDAAFVRTLNYGQGRESIDALAGYGLAGVPTVPDRRFVAWYDNKAAQISSLKNWMPETHLIIREADVPAMDFPFVSKSAHGSGSKNVRLIETPEQAAIEVMQAFGEGIPTGKGEPQTGYLIWQEFVSGNAGDIRVVRCGDNLFGLFRGNRSNKPFASGSGRLKPITEPAGQALKAFELAREISDSLGLRWVCFDIVFRGADPLCLEMSSSWSEPAYVDCPCFDVDALRPNGRTAAEWADLAVDELERIAA